MRILYGLKTVKHEDFQQVQEYTRVHFDVYSYSKNKEYERRSNQASKSIKSLAYVRYRECAGRILCADEHSVSMASKP